MDFMTPNKSAANAGVAFGFRCAVQVAWPGVAKITLGGVRNAYANRNTKHASI
jgi:hypothetical protein